VIVALDWEAVAYLTYPPSAVLRAWRFQVPEYVQPTLDSE
jgi:hypothetical protein